MSGPTVNQDFRETLEYLNLHSTISDLPDYRETVNSFVTGYVLFKLFNNDLNLPGVLVVQQGELLGVISKEKFLAFIGKPFGVEVYLKRPVTMMLERMREPLVLKADCPIIEACRLALSRPIDSLFDPIIYQQNDQFKLINFHTLLLAQSQLLEISNRFIQHQKETSEKLVTAGADLSISLDANQVIEATIANVREFLHCDCTRIYLKNEDRFEIIASDYSNKFDKSDYILKLITTMVATNRKLFFIEDACVYDPDHDHDFLTWIGLPLISHSELLGVLILSFRSKKSIDDEKLSLLQVFTGYASSALHNSINFTLELKRAKQMENLSSATAAFVTITDPEQLMIEILNQSMLVAGKAIAGQLFVFSQREHHLKIIKKYFCGLWDPNQEYPEIDVYIENWAKINQVQIVTGKIVELVKNKNRQKIMSTFSKQTGFILLPLVNENILYGALMIIASEHTPINKDDINLLKTFCSTATSALVNTRLLEEIKELSITDSLTSLFNRRGFFKFAAEEIIRAYRAKQPVCAVMIDLDHFKRVNDYYGHEIGDVVLQEVALRCLQTIRSGDYGCRYGGEEFLFLLPGTNIEQAHQIAERLRKTIADTPVVTSKGALEITASIGVAKLETYHETYARGLEQMLVRADQAMYWAKLQGRNCLLIWSEETAQKQVQLTDSKQIIVYEPLIKPREEDMRQLQASVFAAEEHLSSILLNASEAIITIDQQQRIVVFNRSAESTFNYKLNEIIGKNVNLIIPEIESYLEQKSDTKERFLTMGLRKNQEHFPIELSSSSFMANSQILTTIIMSDITERKISEERIASYHHRLSNAYDMTIETLANALEFRDIETYGHSQRVVEFTTKLAMAFGFCEEELIYIRRGALLHDIGKIAIPDEILQKKGPLSDEEWTLMQQHPSIAYKLLSPIEFLKPSLNIPLHHHEHWDGSGYPNGLKENEIPLAARLFTVVDIYDALTSDRPYRKKWTEEKTRIYLMEQAGKIIDPEILPLFFKILDDGRTEEQSNRTNQLIVDIVSRKSQIEFEHKSIIEPLFQPIWKELDHRN